MSYSVHIIRQTADGQEIPITLDEWNAYIEEDPELKRREPEHRNNSKTPELKRHMKRRENHETLVLLPPDAASPDDWQSLLWVSGSLSADYPQQPMLKKMGQIARHFDAVVMNDDGDIWAIDESGKVSMKGY